MGKRRNFKSITVFVVSSMVAIGNLTLADTLTYQDGDTNGYSGTREKTIHPAAFPTPTGDRLRARYLPGAVTGPERYNIMMRFNGIENKIPQDYVVTSATLTLAFRAQSPDFNPATIDIYKLGKNWDENNMTWEATGLGDNWVLAGAQSRDANDLDRSIEKTTTFMGRAALDHHTTTENDLMFLCYLPG